MINYFDNNTPLTISIWDFSWLMANHPGGAFENLAQRVEEAKNRGYNTIRIDCFPSHILEGVSKLKKNWDSKIQIPRWGQTEVEFECDVLKRLAYLTELCRQHDIGLGLDSWNKEHMIGNNDIIEPQEEERIFTEFSYTWVKALRLMREAGILERAVWVAPMNEVPHYGTRNLRSILKLNERIRNEGETSFELNMEIDAVYKRMNHWLGEAIKEEIEKDCITLSYSSLGAETYSNRLTDIYDVVDIHFMPRVIIDIEDRAALEEAGKGASGFSRFVDLETYNLKKYSDAWATACRKHYSLMLKRAREYHENVLKNITLPSGKTLCPIVTESFGPCYFPDHKDVCWKWYKIYNADAVRLIASLPLAGTSLSNYAEPLFRLWNDEDWHRNANLFILNSKNRRSEKICRMPFRIKLDRV
jgi:hypothetical protein